jgi:hypothetical protein
MEMFALMLMWKWFYYAPNTVKEMYDRQEELAKAKGKDFKPQPFKMPPAPGNFGTSTKVSTLPRTTPAAQPKKEKRSWGCDDAIPTVCTFVHDTREICRSWPEILNRATVILSKPRNSYLD